MFFMSVIEKWNLIENKNKGVNHTAFLENITDHKYEAQKLKTI